MPLLESLLLPLVIIVIAVLAYVIYMMKGLKDLSKKDEGNDKFFSLLNQNIQGLESRVDAKLAEASHAIMGVQKHLGEVTEVGRYMKDFQDFLRSPKLRGNMGEQVLHQLLDQHFPKGSYELQYKFRDGQIVDSVVKTQNGMIPIDAKFPLENFLKLSKAELETERVMFKKEFLKDVRKHINDISKKYILPQEGTVEFAVMYVPSDAVWYEIVNSDDDVMKDAQDKKVLLVSPNGFFYYLQTVLIGIRQHQVAKETGRILNLMHSIRIDHAKFGDTMGTLGTHIVNAKGAYDRLQSDYGRVTGKLDQVHLLEAPVTEEPPK